MSVTPQIGGEATGSLVELRVRQSAVAPHQAFFVRNYGRNRLEDVR